MADKPPLSSFEDRPPLSSFEQQDDIALSDVPGQAFSNLGSSAKRFGESLVQPVLHPIETAKNVGRLGLGLAEKAGISPTSGHEQYPNAVGQYFVDRYGSYENWKKTAATDPVGFVADLSVLLTGGESLPGKIGEISEAVNPVRLAGQAATKAGDVASTVGGLVTGRSAETISGAAKAGFEGSSDFLEHLRNPDIHAPDLVTKARKALSEIRHERAIAYQNGMLGVQADHTPLDFTEINQALDQAKKIKQFEGYDFSQLAGDNEKLAAEKVRDKITKAVNHWETLPDQFRTAAGMDALKQYIGDVKDGLQFGSPERKVAEEIYGSVRKTIIDQRPEYAEVMKDYQQASDMLSEIEKTMSLGKKATGDTALRKLLSASRSNVNTNFGRRLELAEELNKRDPSIMPSLHGQALAPWVPGGLRGAGAGVGTAGELGALLTHGVAGLSPTVLAAMASASPRLWGELAYKAGQAGRKVSELTPQQVIDTIRRVDPDILAQLGLSARATEATNAAQ